MVVGRIDGLEIFRQSGGGLQAPIVVQAAGAVEEIDAADLDGNGMDDLIYADNQNGYRISAGSKSRRHLRRSRPDRVIHERRSRSAT